MLFRTCYDLQLNTTQYLMSMLDEQFFIDNSNSANSGLTPVSKINAMVKTVSQVPK